MPTWLMLDPSTQSSFPDRHHLCGRIVGPGGLCWEILWEVSIRVLWISPPVEFALYLFTIINCNLVYWPVSPSSESPNQWVVLGTPGTDSVIYYVIIQKIFTPLPSFHGKSVLSHPIDFELGLRTRFCQWHMDRSVFVPVQSWHSKRHCIFYLTFWEHLTSTMGKTCFMCHVADSINPGPQNERIKHRLMSKLQSGAKPGQVCSLEQSHPAAQT